jgi:hypothetical protein
MEDSIEEMLANLDEFSHLADTVRKAITVSLLIVIQVRCARACCIGSSI